MSASRVSRCLVGQMLVNCVKTRACQGVLLQRYPHNVNIFQAQRLLSTAKCLCKDTKDESGSDGAKSAVKNIVKDDSEPLEKDGGAQNVEANVNSVKPNKLSDVIKATKELEVSKPTSDASSSTDGSSSDSESDSDSSSDSDIEASAEIDPVLDKAAKDVAEVLPGDKTKTRAELLTKVLEKMKKPGAPPKAQPKTQKAAKKAFNPKDLIKPATKKTSRQQQTTELTAEPYHEKKPLTPKLAEAQNERTEMDTQENQEKIRNIVEKMKTVTKKLAESEEAETRRQEKKAQMFKEIEKRRTISYESRKREEQQFETPTRIEEKPVESAFGGQPLGIFTHKPEAVVEPPGRKYLYDILQEEEEAKLHEYPPRNAWEEQIQWTIQGKLWTFPIDNEAGWDDEKKVGFQEHVFLERQLKDFPQRGPIRHFMELVTVALSKNAYMTVKEKHEHIDWFRQYFRNKENVLVGPLGDLGKFKDTESTENKSA